MIIYCDGGSRGNPGPAASAFVVVDDGKVKYKKSKYLGVETNNVAEYTAVLMAVEWLAKQPAATINLDSQLIERQLNGYYKIKNENLKKIFDQIKLKIKDNRLRINFVWNYRTKNTLADDLVNEELDLNGKIENNF